MKQLRAVPAPPQPVRPNILDSRFKYTPAAFTDITKTWRRFGWKPLEEKNESPTVLRNSATTTGV